MNKTTKRFFLFLALVGLWLVDLAPGTVYMPVFVGEAEAIIGRPLTPFSYAGVARRTTRRFVYAGAATTAMAVDAGAVQAAQVQTVAAPPAAAPAPAPAAAFPAGTTVSALPAGCTSVTKDGGDVFDCSGTEYKPKFQSGNLVYVVQ